MSSSTKKSSNASKRVTNREALANKIATIQNCLNLANHPDTIGQTLKKTIPSFNEVAVDIPGLAGPPGSWTDEQIEAHREAMMQREEEIGEERAEMEAEREVMADVFHQLARLQGPGEVFNLPTTPGSQQKVVLDAQNRLQIEPVYPLFAKLWQDFCEALQDLDVSRIRECQICLNLFWARRSDQVACDRVCANRLRVQRFNKKQQERQTCAWQLRTEGKEIHEIADILKVSNSKARQYLSNTRREARKGA